jgi:hypothetical protein
MMLLPEPLRELDWMTPEVSSHQHRIKVVKEQYAFFAALPPAKAGFGRTDRTKRLQPNCFIMSRQSAIWLNFLTLFPR